MSKPIWLDRTEIVMGLAFLGKIDHNLISPEILYPPYNEVLPTLHKHGMSESEVIKKLGYSLYRDALLAAEAILADKKTNPLSWLKALQDAAKKYTSGTHFEKVAKDLMDGKDVDMGKLLMYVSQVDTGYQGLTPFSEVTAEEVQWILTGYDPIDKYVGGIPKAGMVLLVASTGVGKTTLVLKLALSLIRKHKKSKVAIFSLEMLLSQVKARLLKLDPNIKESEMRRLLGAESSYSAAEVYAVAAQYAAQGDLVAIIVDFADLMVEGKQSEEVMGEIYRSMALLAKNTTVPVILVGQLNREAYKGGIPKIHHIRYSGMAEILSSLIFLLYNPSVIVADHAADEILPFLEDRGYIIIGKSRFGFKMKKPGAIQTEWSGEKGWGDVGFHYFPIHV